MEDLLKQAIQVTVKHGSGSIPFLRLMLGIKYKEAVSLIDEMEKLNIVGPKNGTKPRELLIKDISQFAYHESCGLSKEEWEYEQIVDKIKKEKSTLLCINMIKELVDNKTKTPINE